MYDPTTRVINAYGLNYAAYTAGIARRVDFYPASIALTAQDADTYTITARIANTGNSEDSMVGYARVLVKQGTTETQIGAEQPLNLRGCGANQTVSVVWDNIAPGTYTVIVRVAGMGDQVLSNNELQKAVTVP